MNQKPGFLGSSLFPGFDPLPNHADADADDDAVLQSSAHVFGAIDEVLATTSALNPAPFASVQPKENTSNALSNAQKGFPVFASFSFNPSLPGATAPSSVPDLASATTQPRKREKRNDADSESDSDELSRGKDRKEKKTKKDKIAKKHKRSKEKEDRGKDRDKRDDGGRGIKSSHHREKGATVYPANREVTSRALAIPTFTKAASNDVSSNLSLFRMDRRGDSENARYGSASSSKVPRYFSYFNRIYGVSDTRFRVSHRVGNSIVVYSLHKPGERLTSRDFRIALRGTPIRLASMLRKTPTEAISHSDDFIAFPKSSLILNMPSTHDKPQEVPFPVSTNLQETPEFLAETRRLNLRLENNPANLATWLELLALQDSLLRNAEAESTSARAMASLRRSVTEKKVAIYEKALRQHPYAARELVLPMLELVAEVWDAPRLLTTWDRVLKRVSGPGGVGTFEVWDRYVTYRMTSYASFGVSPMLEVFEQCFGVFQARRDFEGSQMALLHFFKRLCSMLFDAGYTERAVALYQAMIEFSCFTPPAFAQMDFEQRMDLFEDFWESECARVGEAGATGWKENVIGAVGVAAYIPKRGDVGDEDEGDDEYAAWFRCEAEAGFMNWAPQRSTTAATAKADDDDDADEDPFATIIFDDIRPFMFDISHPTLKARLVTNFAQLLSCQLNMTESSTMLESLSPCQVQLMNNSLLTSFFPPKSPRGSEGPVPAFPIKNFPLAQDNLFRTAGSCLLDDVQVRGIQDAGHQRLAFLCHLLSQCRSFDDLDDVAMPLMLSLEACEGSKGGLKAALKAGKNMLKEARMNLSLWACYAGLEVARRKLDEARKIYQTAIMSYRTFPLEQQHDAVLLHLAYAELEAEAERFHVALQVLVSFADRSVELPSLTTEERPPATRILKARKFLQEMTSIAMQKCNQEALAPSSQSLRKTACLVACGGLFEYLSTDKIEDALQYFDKMHTKADIPALRELILDSKLRILLRHSKRSGIFVRPGDIRDAIEKAVIEFPHNSTFLTMLVEGEAKFKMENRVRRVIDSCLKTNPSSTLWAFAVWTELHHHIGEVYNQNTVQSLLSRAIECPVGKQAPSLWQLAIVFEILTGNLQRAKQLLFRAIRECPWSKGLYLLVVGELRGVFGADEVAEIVGVMEEKEIRIRIPL
ncbi:NRDE-2, necessary for RNA interference-domain-containing protein [Chytriomyces sp. MP71]|nr:NRDE-2, necessary for RNA interference-domain-containing protein [Chytriomyces sp. MP71]